MTINTILKSVSLITFTFLASCSSTTTEKTNQTKANLDTSISKQAFKDSLNVDSNQVDNKVMTDIYVKAITEYIDAIQEKDKTSFDTLYLGDRKFGTPDDFPNIQLPNKISGVNISLISLAEAHGSIKKLFKKASPMINLMGWVTKTNAEFAFITFFPEFNHQYDCYINYTFNNRTNNYDKDKLSIETLMNDKKGNPSHFTIYQNGKYIGEKPIK